MCMYTYGSRRSPVGPPGNPHCTHHYEYKIRVSNMMITSLTRRGDAYTCIGAVPLRDYVPTICMLYRILLHAIPQACMNSNMSYPNMYYVDIPHACTHTQRVHRYAYKASGTQDYNHTGLQPHKIQHL